MSAQCLAFDVTASFVIYGCTYAHGYIANVFGAPAHLMALIAVGILQRIILCGSANPLPHVIKLVECPNKCDVRTDFHDMNLQRNSQWRD